MLLVLVAVCGCGLGKPRPKTIGHIWVSPWGNYDIYSDESVRSFVVVSEAEQAKNDFLTWCAEEYGTDIYIDDLRIYYALSDFIYDRIPYESDGYFEWWRTPLETYIHGAGDCEDRAVLACAVLMNMDCPHDLFISRGVNRHDGSGHVWLSVRYQSMQEGIYGFDLNPAAWAIDVDSRVTDPDTGDFLYGAAKKFFVLQNVPMEGCPGFVVNPNDPLDPSNVYPNETVTWPNPNPAVVD